MYFLLLTGQGDVLLRSRYDAVAAYLLDPDRGPASRNIESIAEAIKWTDRPGPFARRWVEWVFIGRVDGFGDEANCGPGIHYACLEYAQRAAPDAVEPILEASMAHVKSLLRDRARPERFDAGLRHLSEMLQERVTFPGRALTVLDEVGCDHPGGRRALAAMRRAFALLERVNAAPDDADIQGEFVHAVSAARRLAATWFRAD